ncbi:MAG: cohesin domain-containing protein [Thermoanaerobaculia bacterium]
MSSRRRNPILAALLLLAFGATAARTQEPVSGGIEFKAGGTPGLETIYLRGTGSTDPEGLLRIEIWVNEVTDLYGLGFALQFSQKLLKFPKSRSTVFVEGPFLSGETGQETILLVRQTGKEVIVGLSRKGEVEGVSGSGHLLTLEFRGLGVAGKKLFRLKRRNAFDSSGAAMETVSWQAGKVAVTLPE